MAFPTLLFWIFFPLTFVAEMVGNMMGVSSLYSTAASGFSPVNLAEREKKYKNYVEVFLLFFLDRV